MDNWKPWKANPHDTAVLCACIIAAGFYVGASDSLMRNEVISIARQFYEEAQAKPWLKGRDKS